MGEIIEYGNLQRQKNTISRLLIYWTRIRELSSQPVSVSRLLSEKLQDVSPRSRTMRLASCFQSVIAQYPDNVVIKDIDVMFNPAYQVDILKILTEARKSKPYSVIWPGRYENGTLYYSELICTHYPGHINLNIKLNAWMLSYILRETSISFLPESVRYYNSQYISLRPVKIHQRKQSHLRSHNTSHSSSFQKSFP